MGQRNGRDPATKEVPVSIWLRVAGVAAMLDAVRVVLTGATGNVGTALCRWLVDHPAVSSVSAIARRLPSSSGDQTNARTQWHSVDIAEPDASERLARIFAGADAVVHLAWRITEDHDRNQQLRVNRDGSAAVFDAVRRAGVRHLTFLSSAAVYSPAPPGSVVREDWPRRGIPGSAYSADKVAVEDLLDRVQAETPDLRIVRVRPPTVLQASAAGEIAAMALGRAAPLTRILRGRLPLLPLPSRTRIQVVAAADVADLVGRALLADASGAFNVADEPVLSPAELAELLGGRHVPVPAHLIRALLDVTFRLRLQRLDPSWVDVLVNGPQLDCESARTRLGWRGSHDGRALLTELRETVAKGAGAPAPPL